MVTSRLTATKFTPEHGYLVLRVRANADENFIQLSLCSPFPVFQLSYFVLLAGKKITSIKDKFTANQEPGVSFNRVLPKDI
jgi:hypothetical protein